MTPPPLPATRSTTTSWVSYIRLTSLCQLCVTVYGTSALTLQEFNLPELNKLTLFSGVVGNSRIPEYQQCLIDDPVKHGVDSTTPTITLTAGVFTTCEQHHDDSKTRDSIMMTAYCGIISSNVYVGILNRCQRDV